MEALGLSAIVYYASHYRVRRATTKKEAIKTALDNKTTAYRRPIHPGEKFKIVISKERDTFGFRERIATKHILIENLKVKDINYSTHQDMQFQYISLYDKPKSPNLRVDRNCHDMYFPYNIHIAKWVNVKEISSDLVTPEIYLHGYMDEKGIFHPKEAAFTLDEFHKVMDVENEEDFRWMMYLCVILLALGLRLFSIEYPTIYSIFIDFRSKKNNKKEDTQLLEDNKVIEIKQDIQPIEDKIAKIEPQDIEIDDINSPFILSRLMATISHITNKYI